MRRENRTFNVAIQLVSNLFKSRRTAYHLISDASQPRNKRWDADARINQGFPRFGFYSVFKADKGNLGNTIVQGRIPRSLEIQDYKVGQRGKHDFIASPVVGDEPVVKESKGEQATSMTWVT